MTYPEGVGLLRVLDDRRRLRRLEELTTAHILARSRSEQLVGVLCYVNYLGLGESEVRVRAAYGNERYARLVELKNRYDPTNTFRYNQNIKPSR